MARWQLSLVAAYAVVLVLVAGLVGEPAFVVPYAILGLLIVGYALVHAFIGRRVLARHGGSYEAAVSDNEEPIPSAPDVPDDVRPTGDTPEAHDELSPHDLPRDARGRHAAEAQARAHGGTTSGNVDVPRRGARREPARRSPP